MKIKPSIILLLSGLLILQANAQTETPDFRVESNVILVPTLVTKKTGEIVYNLSAEDFIVEMNGMKQEVVLDESPDYGKISLVVAIQRGSSASLLFGNKQGSSSGQNSIPEHEWNQGAILSGLGTMIENFVGKIDSEIAVVTFDTRVELRHDFDNYLPEVMKTLDRLQGSPKEGAAILDAVSYSLRLLAECSPERRKILLLISETRDHKSKTAKLDEVLRQIAAGNTLVYCVSFRPLYLELVRDLKNPNAATKQSRQSPVQAPHQKPPGPNLLGPILGLFRNALTKNIPSKLADSTGGEYHMFSNRRTFDATLNFLANLFRSSYMLSFQPSSISPGFHNISVRLNNAPGDVVVRARKSYWVPSRD